MLEGAKEDGTVERVLTLHEAYFEKRQDGSPPIPGGGTLMAVPYFEGEHWIELAKDSLLKKAAVTRGATGSGPPRSAAVAAAIAAEQADSGHHRARTASEAEKGGLRSCKAASESLNAIDEAALVRSVGERLEKKSLLVIEFLPLEPGAAAAAAAAGAAEMAAPAPRPAVEFPGTGLAMDLVDVDGGEPSPVALLLSDPRDEAAAGATTATAAMAAVVSPSSGGADLLLEALADMDVDVDVEGTWTWTRTWTRTWMRRPPQQWRPKPTTRSSSKRWRRSWASKTPPPPPPPSSTSSSSP